MQTIITALQKGGVAKSTTALSVAARLQQLGRSVVLIDLDAQRNLSHTLGAATDGVLTSLEVIKEGASLRDAIQEAGGMRIVPASPQQNLINEMNGPGRDYKLRDAIEELGKAEDAPDYIVIDTPPALGPITINALTAADWLLIPTTPEAYSIDAIDDLAETIEAVQKYTNKDLRVAGVALTRCVARTSANKAMTEAIKEVAAEHGMRTFDATVREAVAIKESQAVGQNIYDYAPRSKVAQDYRDLTDELIAVMENGE